MEYPFLIQEPVFPLNSVTDMAVGMLDHDTRERVRGDYDPHGSWLEFDGPATLHEFLGWLRFFADSGGEDPDAIAQADRMYGFIMKQLMKDVR